MRITNHNVRAFTLLVLVLIAISVLAVYGINVALEELGVILHIYFDAPSVSVVFMLLFYIFDAYAWKWPLFRWLKISDPDLSGKWVGHLKSSYDEFQSQIQVEMTVIQTATNITVKCRFDESRSVSVAASFERSEIDCQIALYFFFRNEPEYNATATMATHEGACKLILSSGDELAGYYYSGRNRNNHGLIELRRV